MIVDSADDHQLAWAERRPRPRGELRRQSGGQCAVGQFAGQRHHLLAVRGDDPADRARLARGSWSARSSAPGSRASTSAGCRTPGRRRPPAAGSRSRVRGRAAPDTPGPAGRRRRARSAAPWPRCWRCRCRTSAARWRQAAGPAAPWDPCRRRSRWSRRPGSRRAPAGGRPRAARRSAARR